MLTKVQWQEAATLLPFLADPSSRVVREFVIHTACLCFPSGTTVFEEGDNCRSFTILLSGTVRVFKIGETGREITLYRFARGESCILTANCILSEQQFPAIAVVEDATEALVVPHTLFAEWIDQFAPWRTYVFHLLSQRLATVMAVVDEVAFRRMDVRIAEFLLHNTSEAQPLLAMTHQQIAAELGTSREVVSRILADFASSTLVQLARGTLTVRDREGLAHRAELH